jgi:hypothetical protein
MAMQLITSGQLFRLGTIGFGLETIDPPNFRFWMQGFWIFWVTSPTPQNFGFWILNFGFNLKSQI